MTPQTLTPAEVASVLQTALLGEVSPHLRRVGFDLDDGALTLKFYFDGPIAEVDEESASCVETEVIAGIPDDVQVRLVVERIDTPAKLPPVGRWVYARREQS